MLKGYRSNTTKNEKQNYFDIFNYSMISKNFTHRNAKF